MPDLTVSSAVDTFMQSSSQAAMRSALGVAPANAMGALVINTGSGVNTKTITVDSTFTFSGAPAANAWFSMLVSNGDSSSHILTIPSSFSIAQQSAITAVTIVANGELILQWHYDGSAYQVFGDPPLTSGTGNYVLSSGATLTNSTLVTPALGTPTSGNLANCTFPTLNQSTSGNAATATVLATARAINGVNFDGSAAITVTAAASTLSGSTLAGGVTGSSLTTFGSGMVLGTPASGALTNCTADGTNLIGYRGAPQNSQSAAYTTVLGDAGKSIFHPSSDNNARTFTIDSNANAAFPIGTIIEFINMAATSATIAITSDTLTLLPAGTTGSRTLAQYGRASAEKITSTSWVISGNSALT